MPLEVEVGRRPGWRSLRCTMHGRGCRNLGERLALDPPCWRRRAGLGCGPRSGSRRPALTPPGGRPPHGSALVPSRGTSTASPSPVSGSRMALSLPRRWWSTDSRQLRSTEVRWWEISSSSSRNCAGVMPGGAGGDHPPKRMSGPSFRSIDAPEGWPGRPGGDDLLPVDLLYATQPVVDQDAASRTTAPPRQIWMTVTSWHGAHSWSAVTSWARIAQPARRPSIPTCQAPLDAGVSLPR
jgi:hypothetical protein